MAATSNTGNDDRSISELVHDLSEQGTRLIHQEVALATAELMQKGANAGFGIGLVGGAGILSLYGLGALTASGILLLSTVLKAWIAAAVIAGGIFMVAAAAARVGKSRLAAAFPPLPEATIETAERDVETLRMSIREGRS